MLQQNAGNQYARLGDSHAVRVLLCSSTVRQSRPSGRVVNVKYTLPKPQRTAVYTHSVIHERDTNVVSKLRGSLISRLVFQTTRPGARPQVSTLFQCDNLTTEQ